MAGKWFSIYFGRAMKEELLSWVPEITSGVEKQGVVWHGGGATVWVYVEDEQEVDQLSCCPIRVRTWWKAGNL